MKTSTEYKLILDHYGDLKAERSGVPLINHIDEGILILNSLRADHVTRAAWCLHPMLQSDEDYLRFEERTASWRARAGVERASVPWRSVKLAMEYRAVANSYLSSHPTRHVCDIHLGPDRRVAEMLIADKVQNRKDFEKYHKGTHSNSHRLEEYFYQWMKRLGVCEDDYKLFCNLMKERDYAPAEN